MLASFPAKDVAADRFNDEFHTHDRDAVAAWEEVKAKRRELAIAHTKFDDLPSEAPSNEAHDKQLAKLEQSDIPDYKTKAERERKNWEQLFRTQVLEKLHNALNEVVNLVTLLNVSLKKRPIGTNTYELRHWRNKDYQLYHDLLQASAMAREDDLFFASAEPRFRDAINLRIRHGSGRSGRTQNQCGPALGQVQWRREPVAVFHRDPGELPAGLSPLWHAES